MSEWPKPYTHDRPAEPGPYFMRFIVRGVVKTHPIPVMLHRRGRGFRVQLAPDHSLPLSRFFKGCGQDVTQWAGPVPVPLEA